MTREQQWDKTARFYVRTDRFGPHTFSGLGIVTRPCRWALPGDVLIIPYFNGGGERQAFTGITSKGRRLHHYYMKYQAWKEYPIKERRNGRVYCVGYLPDSPRSFAAGPIRIVDLPDELERLSPVDPAVRAFVLGTLHPGGGAATR